MRSTTTKVKRSLANLLSHPLRIQSLIALTERKASCAELAREFEVDLGTLYFHLDKLHKADLIEVVEQRPAKGSTESFYRAAQRPEIDEDENAALSVKGRLKWSKRIVALILADADTSIQAETFAERPDHSVIRFPTNVDQQGWEDLNEAAKQFLAKAMDIEAQSAGRGGGGIPVRVVSLVFEMPGGSNREQWK